MPRRHKKPGSNWVVFQLNKTVAHFHRSKRQDSSSSNICGAMMLDAHGVVVLRICQLSDPLPTFLRSRRFERVGDWKATRTPPLHVAVQNVVTSPTCQVSYRASDAWSCHSDIHSTFPPKHSIRWNTAALRLRLISPQPQNQKAHTSLKENPTRAFALSTLSKALWFNDTL